VTTVDRRPWSKPVVHQADDVAAGTIRVGAIWWLLIKKFKKMHVPRTNRAERVNESMEILPVEMYIYIYIF